MRRQLRRARLSFLFVAAFALATPIVVLDAAPAGASCASPVTIPAGIARADVVVVGTVTGTHSRGRIAEVSVVERWKGDVGSTFELAGGPAADNTMTTVDRSYDIGTTYLLFAMAPALHHSAGSFGAALEDNACSNTEAWTANLARDRPSSVIPASQLPTGAPTRDAPATLPAHRATRATTRLWPWALIPAAIVAVASMVLAVRMRAARTI